MVAGPGDSEQIRHVVMNIRAQKGMAGAVRDYDVFFMDNGVLFACTAGSLKSTLKASVGAQFGAVGALAARASMDKDKQNGRAEYQGLTAKQILERNDKSFYLPYLDVQTVTLKKGLTGIGKMSLQVPDGKYNCEFSKDQMDAVKTAVAEKMSAKMEA
ncbi:MAG: hypothetical protein SA339_12760 [Methanomassiliicoccus sp.]|nr:hypothetical protein [Methanomassiliicoccus sp.]